MLWTVEGLMTDVGGMSEGGRDHLTGIKTEYVFKRTSRDTCQIIWTCGEAWTGRDFCLTTITNHFGHFHLKLMSAAINNNCYSSPANQRDLRRFCCFVWWLKRCSFYFVDCCSLIIGRTFRIKGECKWWTVAVCSDLDHWGWRTLRCIENRWQLNCNGIVRPLKIHTSKMFVTWRMQK